MNRSLIAQMRNEWSDNLWLIIELFIVAIIIWGLADILVKSFDDYHQPTGFEYENVFSADISRLDSLSPKYVDLGANADDANYADLQSLTGALRALPEVEYVCVGSNMMPYSLMGINTAYHPEGFNDTVQYIVNMRWVTPEAAEVFRYQSRTGKSVADLHHQLESGNILLGYYSNFERFFCPATQLRGKKIVQKYSDSDNLTVGDIINTVRRTDYEYPQEMGGAIIPLLEQSQLNRLANQIAVRVKPGHGTEFLQKVNSDTKLRHLRNTNFSQFESLADKRTAIQWNDTTALRLKIFGIIFVLLIVFLGLLGTFWFRIQQRTEEIAVRLVCGATRLDILRRIFSESLIILGIAIIPAFIAIWGCLIWWKVDWLEQFRYYFGWESIALAAMLLTAVLMAAMILCGVWMPARKAMAIEPAIALKEE